MGSDLFALFVLEKLCVKELKSMMNKKQLLERTRLFVLDMDGTFYLGSQLLKGSLEFLSEVSRLGKKFIFFTNNSSDSADNYIRKLAKMGCSITKEEIMTSGDVTAIYLMKNFPEKKVYLLGTRALEQHFQEYGIRLVKEDADIVVVGFDKTLDYDKLTKACTLIRNGAEFISTHLDINCPTETGFIPDCGSICAAIELSTGKHPHYLGKPFRETVDMILEKTKIPREYISFVGDRIYTDVKTGVNNGANGILVLSGETRLEDIEKSDVKPDAVFEGLYEMAEVLKE